MNSEKKNEIGANAYGCGFVVRRVDDGITSFVMRVRAVKFGYDLVSNFCRHSDRSTQKTEA
jgi:hypothetical protein